MRHAYYSVDPEPLHTGYIARRVAFLTGLNSLPAPILRIPGRRPIAILIRLAERKMGWGHGPNRITEWGGDTVANVDCYCNTAVKVREKPATITKAMHLKIMRPRFDADQEENMMRVLNHNA